MGGRLQSCAFALQTRACSDAAHLVAEPRRSAALDEEHALFASGGACGEGVDVRCPLRPAGFHLSSRRRTSSAWVVLTGVLFCQPRFAIAGGRLGSGPRPACTQILLALSAARSAWIRDLAGKLHQPRISVARGNLPVWRRGENHSKASAGSDSDGRAAAALS